MLVWLIIALLGFNIFTSLLGPANTRTPPNPLISHTVSYAPAAYNDSASREENLHHKISEISPSGYVDPGLLQSSGVTQVFLIANDSLPIEEIAEYTLSCRATPSFGDLRLVMATMEVENIMPLAETRGMIALLKNRRVKYPISTRIPSLSTSASSFKDFFRTTPSPQAETLSRKPKNTMRDVAGILGANHTWQTYGIDGANTTIAIVDTGVDYGAFSLAYWDSLAKDVENKTAAFNADATAMAFTNITVEAYQTPQGTFIPTSGTDPYIYFPETPAVIHRFSEIIGDPWFADMNVTGIVAEGERCHFGLMFQWLFGLDLFPVLVVDGDHDGRYDTTYVDLSFDWSWIPLVYYLSYGQAWPFWTAPWPPDFSFTDELALSPEDSTPAVRDFTGDGIYDLSGGVLGYFLDIWSMAPNIYDRGLILEPIDPYGNYTCFVNDWFGHGTQCASSAAGRESLHPLAGPGIAPGAKIMGVVALWIGDIIEGELWAAGFDLIPRTRGWKEVPSYGTVYGTWEYTGRHKADIISNSWGWSDWAAGLLEHPWYDILTIFQDALTVPGYLDPEYPGTVITHAGGNGGPGYGTITEPAYGSLVLTVGAATSM
ncbi:MAG: S8 family serine peptidase, partial [Desulfobacterales bacterium]|nr:S8 family serine peptidase [Desulfobacterales bacterium]